MKKGLGKGLEALFAIYDNETQNETYGKEIVTKTFSAPTNDIDINLKAQGSSTEISIDKIYPNPNQPRKIFDKESLHELATSIKTHGLIQPIIVNKTDDGYMIIAGERRYRACKIAGLKTISCIIKKIYSTSDSRNQYYREFAT